MLSYRHGYHAGNHADILKHMVLCLILRSLLQKDKPYTVIDTHSGAGLYDLSSSFSQKNHEYETGFSKIKDNAVLQKLVPEFYEVVEKAHQVQGASKLMYPGSPFFTASLSRKTDSIFLRDLHKAEFESLYDIFKRQRNVHVELGDGLQSLKALLPPVKKRGLILIDPSYEIKHDYIAVVKAVKEINQRFSQGIVAIWYPVLARLNDQSKKLTHELSRLNIPMLQVEMRVSKQEEEFGMCGSGMLVLNFPYNLDQTLEPIVGELYSSLCDPQEGTARLSIVVEKP